MVLKLLFLFRESVQVQILAVNPSAHGGDSWRLNIHIHTFVACSVAEIDLFVVYIFRERKAYEYSK